MNCPNCHEVTEAGAAFCGNCGQPLELAAASTKTVSEIAKILHNQAEIKNTHHGRLMTAGAGGMTSSLPSYAFTKPNQHFGEANALMSLLFGVAGVIGAVFMPVVGLSIAAAGIVLGTLSRHSTKRKLSTMGLIASSIAVLFSLGTWAYNIKNDPKLSHKAVSSSATVSKSTVSTPCYSVGFVDKLNVKNNSNSCDVIAFNGPSLDESTNAYKIYANQAQIVNAKEFINVAKQALEKDVKDSLPNFTIASEKVTMFAGSPAYAVYTINKTQGVTVVEQAVLHAAGNGQNIFVLVHATNDSNSDMSTLEAQWQWK